MTHRITARSGIAALAVAGLAAVTACSSSSSSSSSAAAPASSSASAAAASSGANPLSGGGASGTVVIGSANFPENEVLAVLVLALFAVLNRLVVPAGLRAQAKLGRTE